MHSGGLPLQKVPLGAYPEKLASGRRASGLVGSLMAGGTPLSPPRLLSGNCQGVFRLLTGTSQGLSSVLSGNLGCLYIGCMHVLCCQVFFGVSCLCVFWFVVSA